MIKETTISIINDFLINAIMIIELKLVEPNNCQKIRKYIFVLKSWNIIYSLVLLNFMAETSMESLIGLISLMKSRPVLHIIFYYNYKQTKLDSELK